MSEIRYICSSCSNMVTVTEFKEGKDKCAITKCDQYGQKLERGEYCSSCNTNFEEGEDHICF